MQARLRFCDGTMKIQSQELLRGALETPPMSGAGAGRDTWRPAMALMLSPAGKLTPAWLSTFQRGADMPLS